MARLIPTTIARHSVNFNASKDILRVGIIALSLIWAVSTQAQDPSIAPLEDLKNINGWFGPHDDIRSTDRTSMRRATLDKKFQTAVQNSGANVETQSLHLHRIANFWDSQLDARSSPQELQKAWTQSLLHWEDYLTWHADQSLPSDDSPENKRILDVLVRHQRQAVQRTGKALKELKGHKIVCEKLQDYPASSFDKTTMELFEDCLEETAPRKDLVSGHEALPLWQHLLDVRTAYQGRNNPSISESFKRATARLGETLKSLGA